MQRSIGIVLAMTSLLFPTTAGAACQSPLWDEASSTYTINVAATDDVDDVGIGHVGDAQPYVVNGALTYGSITVGDCTLGRSNSPEPVRDFRHVVIHTERALSLGISGPYLARYGDVRVAGAHEVDLHVGASYTGRPYTIRATAEGLDFGGDDRADVVFEGSRLDVFKMQGEKTGDDIDLRSLTARAWGRNVRFYFMTGEGRFRRTIRTHDTFAYVVGNTAALTFVATGPKRVMVHLTSPLNDGRRNFVSTGSGNDDVSLGGGFDVVRLGAGDDYYSMTGDSPSTSQTRRVRVFGGTGRDVLAISGSHSYADGGPGDDKLSAYGEGNFLYGREGRDTITARGSWNYVDGGSGDDDLVLYMPPRVQSKGRVICGSGTDVINYARPIMVGCERLGFRYPALWEPPIFADIPGCDRPCKFSWQTGPSM